MFCFRDRRKGERGKKVFANFLYNLFGEIEKAADRLLKMIEQVFFASPIFPFFDR